MAPFSACRPETARGKYARYGFPQFLHDSLFRSRSNEIARPKVKPFPDFPKGPNGIFDFNHIDKVRSRLFGASFPGNPIADGPTQDKAYENINCHRPKSKSQVQNKHWLASSLTLISDTFVSYKHQIDITNAEKECRK